MYSQTRKVGPMKDDDRLNAIRGATLNALASNEKWFKVLLGLCGLAETIGLIAVFWFMDWSDSTHRLVFAATMLVWINLALWVWTLAMRNRAGEQRVLRAIETLYDLKNEES